MVGPEQGEMILDAGCGTGNILHALYEVNPFASLCGIDLSENMLQRAQEKFTQYRNVAFMKGDLDKELMFFDNSFTKVVSVNVLYAVASPWNTLREFWRIMRPQARLVIVTPKAGYDNGYILKEHAGSTKPDAHWKDAHRSPEREEFLLREALLDDELVRAMQLVAAYNRVIAQNRVFHFFTEEELGKLMEETGFSVERMTPTYAGQAFLVVARKR